MQRQYIFEDFQPNNSDDEEEVNMECGIAIPIRNITDLPIDIATIVNNSVSMIMKKFEKKNGNVHNLSSLHLEAWLQVDENGSNKHYIGLLLYDNVGNDARTNIYIRSKDDCYLSFAKYCASKLNRHLFTI